MSKNPQNTSDNVKDQLPTVPVEYQRPPVDNTQVVYPVFDEIPHIVPIGGQTYSQGHPTTPQQVYVAPVQTPIVQNPTAPIQAVSGVKKTTVENAQTPLLSDYSSVPEISPVIVNPVEEKPRQRRLGGSCCLKCTCCCCIALVVVLGVGIVLALLGSGIAGAVVGIGAAVCHNYADNTGSIIVPLNDTIHKIVFDNYGDAKIVEDDTFSLKIDYSIKGDESKIKFEWVDGTVQVTGPGRYWMFICEGYDIEIHKPAGKMVDIEAKNHYGDVDFSASDVGELSINKGYGKVKISDVSVLSDLLLHTRYTTNKLTNVDVLGDFTVESSYAENVFEDMKVMGKYSHDSGYGDSRMKSVEFHSSVDIKNSYHSVDMDDVEITGDVSIDSRYSDVGIDCSTRSFSGAVWVKTLGYSDLKIRDCSFNVSGDIVFDSVYYSDVEIARIVKKSPTKPKCARIDIKSMSYSDITLKEIEFFAVDVESSSYSDLRYEMSEKDFLPYEVSFDLKGSYSDLDVDSDYSDLVTFDEKTSSSVVGKINKDGDDGNCYIRRSGSYGDVDVNIS